MARTSTRWPRFDPPPDVGPLSVADVLAVEPGPPRDEKLLAWCASVWSGWSSAHGRVREMVVLSDDSGRQRTSCKHELRDVPDLHLARRFCRWAQPAPGEPDRGRRH